MFDAIATATTFLGRWADDPVGGMSMVSSDVVYTLNVDPDALQIGGETRGWDAVNAMMLGIREVFDYSTYQPKMLGTDGKQVRFNIELAFRHKPSGELLSGNMRSVVTVHDGLVVRVDEYADAPMVEAFMRLFSSGDQGQMRG